MISKTKIIVYLSLFLLVITGIRLAYIQYHKPPDHPPVIHGVLDLRESPLQDDAVITLNGEWEFYPSLFVTPDDSHPYESEKRSIQVPGGWEKAFPPSDDSSFRYGTYRLRILTNADDQSSMLRIHRINNASAVYVNGQLMEQSGTPSSVSERHRARSIPYSVTIPPGNSTIEIIVHVSNSAGKGGMVETIRYGTADAVNRSIMFSWVMQIGLTIVFLVHGIYAAMLFFFGVANKGLLYFSALMLFAILSVLVADDKLLYVWFETPYEITVKITLLSYIGVVSFIPLLLNQIYRGSGNPAFIRWFLGYNLAYALFVGLGTAPWLMASTRLLGGSFVLSIIVSAHIVLNAIRKREDVLFVFFGVTAVGANITWAIAEKSFSYSLMHYPFDLMIAVVCFAALWFKRFFRAVNETKRLADQLQLANRRKDDFLVNTSHELRNPLHGIINIAQSIMDDSVHPIPETHRQRLDIQIAVGRRLSMLLDDLVDVTRLNDSTIRLQITNVHIQAIVHSIVDMVRFMLDGKPIALRIGISDNFPSVRADENRVAQIIFNLIHNAIKFTDKGVISVRADLGNGMAIIQIEDTGIGMDEETQSRVFAPYEQGHSDRSIAVGGVGLGLSISKQLVELHGGTLTVASTPGEGTAFTFTLPLAEHSDLPEPSNGFIVNLQETIAASLEATEEPVDSGSHKPRILVVDDDRINLKILSDLIGSVRYDVITVTSAAEAVVRLEKGRYDLLLSDVMMPQLSGYELTRIVRDQFSAFELPILLLTARNRTEDIVAGFQAGANDYVVKPVNAWELKARMNALIALKSSIGERLRMEAAWLQAQIQPHFLFNTINSIAALGTMNIPKMQKLLEEFSNYLRTSFDFHNSDRLVPIHRELALVRSYLYIETERFGERLEVLWEADPNLSFLLPPMSIQTLVENAVKHGVTRRPQGGKVEIRIQSSIDHIEVCVRDNGVGIGEEQLAHLLDQPPDKHKGIGLRNTDRRLKQLYGQGLRLSSVPNEGTAVSFRIPRSEG